MALARLLTLFALTVQRQMTFGAQFNLVNNYVEATKAFQQQSHIRNTDSVVVAKINDNIGQVQKLNIDFNQPFPNQTATTHNGSTITNIKLFNNQGYSVPAPSFTLINSNARTTQPLFANPIHTDVNGNFPIIKTNAVQLNTRSDQTTTKPVNNGTGIVSNIPLYINLGSQSTAPAPSQATYLTSIQPTTSFFRFVPNVVKLLNTASPSQNKQLHPTVTSVANQPSNVQNEANYQQARAQPLPAAVPVRDTTDSAIQSRHSLTSLLLSHILSQSCHSQDSPSPPVINQTSRKSKPSNTKTLLPILLSLMSERSNNGCEGGKLYYHNRHKERNMDDGVKVAYLEKDAEWESKDRVSYACKKESHREPNYMSDEDDDYSDESSEYSTENYDYD